MLLNKETKPNLEVRSLNDTEAFVNVLIMRWGVPLQVITNWGKQFESELFAKLSQVIGFYRLHTTTYYSQYNDFIEKLHRTITTAIIVQKEFSLSPFQ